MLDSMRADVVYKGGRGVTERSDTENERAIGAAKTATTWNGNEGYDMRGMIAAWRASSVQRAYERYERMRTSFLMSFLSMRSYILTPRSVATKKKGLLGWNRTCVHATV